MFESVNIHCKKLEHLQLTFYLKSENDLNGLDKSIAENLKSLHVILSGRRVCDSALSRILEKTTNLTDFLIQAHDHFKGSSLLKLPETCQTLSFVNCLKLKNEFFSKVLLKLPNLKNLNILNCRLIKASALYPVCNQLISLKFGGVNRIFFDDSDFNYLSFPNLKILKTLKI